MAYKRGNLWYDIRDKNWAELYDKGMTYQQIADLYHYHREYVSERVRAYNKYKEN